MRWIATALAMLLWVAIASPASADDRAGAAHREVGLSADGTHYADALDRPLFDPQVRWVPGDERRSTFWVRNQAGSAGDLTVDLTARSRSTLFDSGYLRIAARAGHGPWHVVSGGESLRLLTRQDLPAKAEVPVTLRVTLAPGAPNGTMVLATDLDLRVTLSDVRATGGAAGPGSGHGPHGFLPSTGSSASWWLVPVGLLLLLSGVLLLTRRRSLHPATLPAQPSGEPR